MYNIYICIIYIHMYNIYIYIYLYYISILYIYIIYLYYIYILYIYIHIYIYIIHMYIYTHYNSSFRCYIPTCGKGKIYRKTTSRWDQPWSTHQIQGAFMQEDIRVVLCEGGPQPQRDQHHLGFSPITGISAPNMLMILVNQETNMVMILVNQEN